MVYQIGILKAASRGPHSPALREFERLASEVFYFSGPRMTGTLPQPITVTITYLAGVKIYSPTESFRLLQRWKGKDCWEIVEDAQHDVCNCAILI